VSRVVPRLRFPEFRGKEGWEEKKLGNEFEFLSTATNSRADLSTEGDVSYVHYGDIHTKFHTVIDFQKVTLPKISSQLVRTPANLKNGDVIIADASEDTEGIAKAVEVVELTKGVPAIAGLHTILIRSPQLAFEGRFLGFLFGSDFLRTQTARLAVGTKVYSISKTQLALVRLVVPGGREQSKIAACLSSLDDLVSAHQKKLKALKAYRKGLMQGLFPAEGETVPRLRFPEFRGAKEWERAEIQQFCEVIRGASPRPQGDPRYYGGTVPRLMGRDVARDGKWVTPKIDFLTEEGAKLSRPCKRGTLTVICSGDVGVPSFLAVDACIHDGFLALTDLDTKKVDTDFLYYCLVGLQEQFQDSATQGGVFVNLTTTILKEFPVSIPSLAEQQRIAASLSSVDDQIAVQSQLIDQLKRHKKGLVQQLFPSVADMENNQ